MVAMGRRVVFLRPLTVEYVQAFRWHVLRKPTDAHSADDGSPPLYMGIARGTDHCAQKFIGWLHEPATDRPSTTIEDWGQDSEVEGVVSEDELVAAVSRNYILEPVSPTSRPPDTDELFRERRVVEDMVFVQLVRYRDGYDALLHSLDGNWPDVTELVRFPHAVWVDYTQQARAEAKELYKQLLREDSPEEGAPHDSQ